MSAPVLQVRVPDDTLARIDKARGDDSRSARLQRLIDRELTGQQSPGQGVITTPSTRTASPLGALGPGEPSPDVLRMGPGCLERSTSR